MNKPRLLSNQEFLLEVEDLLASIKTARTLMSQIDLEGEFDVPRAARSAPAILKMH